MTRSPAARSARPVSVMSTTQSAMSGTLASLAPYDSRTSASMPASAKKRRVSSGYSDDTRTPSCRSATDAHRRVVGDGDDHADRVGRRLRVAQLAEADDVAGRLLDPVAPGDADVEQPLGDVDRDLLGRRMRTSSTRGSSMVARYSTADERTTPRSAASNSSSVARSSDPFGSTMRSTAPDAIGRPAGLSGCVGLLVEQAQGVGQDVEHGAELLDAALRRARRVADDRPRRRTPAMPRDRRPSGLIEPHRLGQPGASRSITARVPSGVWSRGRSRCRRS